MKFNKELLIELVGEHSISDEEGNELRVVTVDQIDTRRWESVHEMVFSFCGRLYSSTYRMGLTEIQESSPYEYDDQEVECPEVEAYEVTVTKYRPIVGD